ncbi:helix-turn-helix domain-containing protein [Streptomyces zhihengii]|uniref:Helix-turn-helix domain-containing protein n=1 Tax=Streptomyces zhihengii TaxID=1818004 RepID=A0ABS2V1Z9_9ACTN|nr:MarR family transcriptional regulator [Streptomyces zhihengii]MBM9623492.1 helix-turn-helix domain-containing protein [Streptomyces zhihengii]
MGGGRLTPRDREDIEAGLAEGLACAAIARRLGRPTSTVSREVARNGGRGGYRAEHADRAAVWRRRDRRPPRAARRDAGTGAARGPDHADAAGGPLGHGPDGTGDDTARGADPAAVHAYVDGFAAVLAGAGLPRTAARALACLVTAPSGALTAAELAERLRVSPASVSKAVGYLEALDVLTRRYEPGRRRPFHVVDDGVWLRTWRAGARKNAVWAETARRGIELFGAGSPAGVRLEAMRRFFAGVHREMAGASATEILDDAGTVVAALLHAGRPLTAGELAGALGWTRGRTAAAVDAAEHPPDATGPVALRRTPSGALLVGDRQGRLTPAQRTALARPVEPPRPAADPTGRP